MRSGWFCRCPQTLRSRLRRSRRFRVLVISVSVVAVKAREEGVAALEGGSADALAGDRILLVSYGSGAGSDAFSLRATDRLPQSQGRARKTQDYIARRVEIDYATYARFRGKLTMK